MSDPLATLIRDGRWLKIAGRLAKATPVFSGSTILELEDSVSRAEERANQLLKSMSVTNEFAEVPE